MFSFFYLEEPCLLRMYISSFFFFFPPPLFLFSNETTRVSLRALHALYNFPSSLRLHLIIDSITTKVLYRDDFTNFNERSVGRRFAKSFQKDSSCSGSWVQKKKKKNAYLQKEKRKRDENLHTAYMIFLFRARKSQRYCSSWKYTYIYIHARSKPAKLEIYKYFCTIKRNFTRAQLIIRFDSTLSPPFPLLNRLIIFIKIRIAIKYNRYVTLRNTNEDTIHSNNDISFLFLSFSLSIRSYPDLINL